MRTFINRHQISKNRVKHPLLLGPKMKDKADGNQVKLSKCKKIILSNRHLRELYTDLEIKQKIKSILFEFSKDEIISVCEKSNKNIKDNDKLSIPFNNDTWKCKMFISWQEIEIIRNWICDYEIHLSKGSYWKKCELMLLRKLEFGKKTFNENEEEEDENVKNINVKYEKTHISPVVLNIHVYSKV